MFRIIHGNLGNNGLLENARQVVEMNYRRDNIPKWIFESFVTFLIIFNCTSQISVAGRLNRHLKQNATLSRFLVKPFKPGFQAIVGLSKDIKNFKKTKKLLEKYKNLQIKRKSWLFSDDMFFVYKVEKFGHPKIDRLVLKLKAKYKKVGVKFPEIEFVPFGEHELVADANKGTHKIRLSIETLSNILKGETRELIHELRHIGNTNLSFFTSFSILNTDGSVFNFDSSHLVDTYGKGFNAEEVNNYMRWHRSDRSDALSILTIIERIQLETRIRKENISKVMLDKDFISFLSKERKPLFEIYSERQNKPFASIQKRLYVSTLVINDFDRNDELTKFILSQTNAVSTNAAQSAKDLSVVVRFFSLEKPPDDPKMHLDFVSNSLKKTIKTSNDLLFNRASRKEPKRVKKMKLGKKKQRKIEQEDSD